MKFEDSRPDRKRRALRAKGELALTEFVEQQIPSAKIYTFMSYEELTNGLNYTFAYDVESYPNYFEVGFRCVDTGKVICFEDSEYGHFVNGVGVNQEYFVQLLSWIIYRFTLVGFNSRTYDLPIIMTAIKGVRAPMLNQIGNEIIRNDMPLHEVERRYCGKLPTINHIDLIEVAPLQASLKAYGGRLHCERLQDLPFPPETLLELWQQYVVRDYNINDLDITVDLWRELKNEIELRGELGREYKADLRSRSDAQLAEVVINSELDRLGIKGKPPEYLPGEEFYYQVPEFISFKTPQLQRVLEVVRTTPFVMQANGYTAAPKAIEALKPQLGRNTYRLGAGGLHSSEESLAVEADENTLLIDRDVSRYYPSIILNNKLCPKHLGEGFLKVYEGIVNKRDMAKVAKDKKTDQSLKIVINGTFGKLGNPFSQFYAPDLLIQVTMTGQLSLLMLIEDIELAGISIISANTDGIVIQCPKDRYKDLDTVVMIWENLTGFVTEETRYKRLCSRDVNNYIAIKEGGGCKTKGVYSNVGSALNSPLSKNPECYIVSMALQAFLEHGIPLEETIYNCRDIRQFLAVRNVKGGATKDGIYLGKVVRWYYAKNQTGEISYVLTRNKVPKSEGAKPCMTLPSEFPVDIDFDRYINDANEELYNLGVLQRLKTGVLL